MAVWFLYALKSDNKLSIVVFIISQTFWKILQEVSKSAFKVKFGQDEYAEVKWEKQLKQLIQEKLIK